MEQSIVITDIFDYYEEYKGGYTLSGQYVSAFWEELMAVMEDYENGHSLNIVLQNNPEDGTLLLFTVSGIVACIGVFSSSLTQENGCISFHPGTFIPLYPIDYWREIDPYVDYNLLIVSEKEALYFINKYDFDGNLAVASNIRRGIYNSPGYRRYIWTVQEIIGNESNKGNFIDRFRKARRYENYNCWDVWDYNIMMTAFALSISDKCVICGKTIPFDEYQIRSVETVVLPDIKVNREPKNNTEIVYSQLIRYVTLCPACYHRYISGHCDNREITIIKDRVVTRAEEYFTKFLSLDSSDFYVRNSSEPTINSNHEKPSEIEQWMEVPEECFPSEQIIEVPIDVPSSLSIEDGKPIVNSRGNSQMWESHGIDDWEEESILKANGYSVAANTKMTAYQRWEKIRD